MSRPDSWKNQYHAVEEFELPLERDRMLPNQPSSPTPPTPALMSSESHPPEGGIRRVPPAATGMSASSSSSSGQQHPVASTSSTQPTIHSNSSTHRNSRSFPSSPLNPQGTPPAGTSLASSSLTGRPSTSSGGSHTMQHDPSKPLPRSPNSQSTLTAGSLPPVPTSPFGRPGSRGSFTFNNSRSPSHHGLAALSSAAGGGGGSGLSGTQTPTSELLAAHHSFGGGALPTVGSRGSMILYRRAESGLFSPPIGGGFVGIGGGHGGGGSGTVTPVQVPSHTGVSGMSGMSEDAPSHAGLLPPQLPFSNNRASVYSTSGDSLYGVERGLVAYAYDPDEDDESDDEEGDWLHDPEVAYPGTKGPVGAVAAGAKGKGKPLPRPGTDPKTGLKITDPSHPLYIPKPYIAPRVSWRGLVNIGTLVAMVASLLCLFVVYPMVRFYADDGINARITGNLRINSTGQAEYFPDEDSGANADQDGATPTSTRPPRTTVTSLNEGGNIFDRRDGGILGILRGKDMGGRPLKRDNGNVMWKREVDDWAVEFPAPSYNLHFFGGDLTPRVVPVEVVDAVDVEAEVEVEVNEAEAEVEANKAEVEVEVNEAEEAEEVKRADKTKQEEPKQVVHVCLPYTPPTPSTPAPTSAASSSSSPTPTPAPTDQLGDDASMQEAALNGAVFMKVEFGVGGDETVEGFYENGDWAFHPISPRAEEEQESDDGWVLVKKQASTSTYKRLILSLVGDSTPDDPEVEIRTVQVYVRSEAGWGWQMAMVPASEDGGCACFGGEEAGEVQVGVLVEDVVQGLL
ncbi:hypothetical protein BKA70DRAFT_684128 [Coprinopsis sp. MPI-PUGE-AT-0042]|nr:hypothetical protein BKA70DRAFT_684128 [Coprinopsis sp. MPI-PUGE-AT-0042]